MSALLALALLLAAGLILVLRHDAGTIAGFAASDFAMLTTGLALLIFIGGPLLRGYRGGLVGAMRDAIAWSAMALVLVVIYSYKNDLMPLLQRVQQELMPNVPVAVSTDQGEPQAVRVRKQLDGQFVATTDVNGTKIAMIVDTGASTVVLRAHDARLAGIDLDSLAYSTPVQTANGRSFAAHIRLQKLSIGTVSLSNVEALVARPGALHQSLLGMSFLSRLRSYEFSGDFLTLRS